MLSNRFPLSQISCVEGSTFVILCGVPCPPSKNGRGSTHHQCSNWITKFQFKSIIVFPKWRMVYPFNIHFVFFCFLDSTSRCAITNIKHWKKSDGRKHQWNIYGIVQFIHVHPTIHPTTRNGLQKHGPQLIHQKFLGKKIRFSGTSDPKKHRGTAWQFVGDKSSLIGSPSTLW